MAQVSYKSTPSREHPHVEWIELYNDGILHECAVLKKDLLGNILFFRINELDDIDKRRLAGILSDRNARSFELFDLMAGKTLGNGMNALAYFSQLAKQLTVNGKVIMPNTGTTGVGVARA